MGFNQKRKRVKIMLEKQRKRNCFISLAVCLLMLGALVMPMNVQEVSAASSTYMSVIPDYEENLREKVGGYHIWVERDYSAEERLDYLKCTKSTKKKAKVLASTTSDSFFMNSEVVSNGKYVFYAVGKRQKTTIYRVAVKGGKPKTLKTLKGNVNLGTYYNGRLYFELDTSRGVNLMSLKVSNKTTRTERKNFYLDSGYGPYLTGIYMAPAKHGDRAPETILLYNGKTRKTTKLLAGQDSVAAGKWIYTYNYDLANIQKPTLIVKRCDLAGKNVRTIKKYKTSGYVSYFGRKGLYLKEGRGNTVKKLNYSTGKITKAR